MIVQGAPYVFSQLWDAPRIIATASYYPASKSKLRGGWGRKLESMVQSNVNFFCINFFAGIFLVDKSKVMKIVVIMMMIILSSLHYFVDATIIEI